MLETDMARNVPVKYTEELIVFSIVAIPIRIMAVRVHLNLFNISNKITSLTEFPITKWPIKI